MSEIIYVMCVAAVLAWSGPALVARGARLRGALLAVFLPPFSWAWLLWIGYQERARVAELERRELGRVEAELARRRLQADVAFWRDRLQTGTPLERETARLYLAAIGQPEQPSVSEVCASELGTSSQSQLLNLEAYYDRMSRSPVTARRAAHLSQLKRDAVRIEISRRGAR